MKQLLKDKWTIHAPVSSTFIIVCALFMLLPERLRQELFILPGIPGKMSSDFITIFNDRVSSSGVFLYMMRLFTANLCHANFTHFFYNIIPIIILGPMIEGKLGRVKTFLMILYIMLISSVMVSSTIRFSLQGSSTVAFGYYGSYLMIKILDLIDTKPLVLLISLIVIPISLFVLHLQQMRMIQLLYVWYNPSLSLIGHISHMWGMLSGILFVTHYYYSSNLSK